MHPHDALRQGLRKRIVSTYRCASLESVKTGHAIEAKMVPLYLIIYSEIRTARVPSRVTQKTQVISTANVSTFIGQRKYFHQPS